jgi:hypothetical protein
VFRYASAPWFTTALQLLANSGVRGVAVDVWVRAAGRVRGPPGQGPASSTQPAARGALQPPCVRLFVSQPRARNRACPTPARRLSAPTRTPPPQWSAVERTPRSYNWTGYRQLLELLRPTGLRLQAVLAFHACGGNVGDAVEIPLPEWVLQVRTLAPTAAAAAEPRAPRARTAPACPGPGCGAAVHPHRRAAGPAG